MRVVSEIVWLSPDIFGGELGEQERIDWRVKAPHPSVFVVTATDETDFEVNINELGGDAVGEEQILFSGGSDDRISPLTMHSIAAIRFW